MTDNTDNTDNTIDNAAADRPTIILDEAILLKAALMVIGQNLLELLNSTPPATILDAHNLVAVVTNALAKTGALSNFEPTDPSAQAACQFVASLAAAEQREALKPRLATVIGGRELLN